MKTILQKFAPRSCQRHVNLAPEHCRWLPFGFMPAILLICSLCLAGCSNGHLPTEGAQGTVTFDGKPLPDANVTFTPESGPSATAITHSDGTFALSTYRDGDGAIVGKHMVAVTARQAGTENPPGAPGMIIPGRSLIPESYGNTATSGLAFEVVASKPNVFSIQLSSVKK